MKYRVGDKITNKKDKKCLVKIATITDTCYIDEYRAFNIPIERQNEWELYTDKFDFSTLKPFDKILIRDGDGSWQIAFFGFINQNNRFTCNNGESFSQCIPFEGNEHLLGTLDDCDDYYKY